MKLNEVMKWKPFTPPGGDPIDLSFLDAHSVEYVHESKDPDKPDIVYTFYVTYSFHCFAKDYDHQTKADQEALMYHAPKDSRPFCYERYELAKKHLRGIIDGLSAPDVRVNHAGYGAYATTKVIEGDQEFWYFVPFKVFRENRKFRLHVTTAYPEFCRPTGAKVGFFAIAKNLKQGKPLPSPPGAGRGKSRGKKRRKR